ncbi:MAG: hypothetical protein CVU39_08340 [Chloroflexi bacterium HGW-Chloroflexi-10]|nr:MAG: hypothetical protein CVU39_08340 [Chloroflexi bacterium HGW-Chloroflexi-10]
MSYRIYPSSDGKYIIQEVEGDYYRKRALELNIEAHAIARGLGINRFLVDLTQARNVDSIYESYEFSYEDMQIEEIDQSARVAVLVDIDDNSHDFIETVSRNAGSDVTLFRDVEKARQHLLAD